MRIEVDTDFLDERGAALRNSALEARNIAAQSATISGFGATADMHTLESVVSRMQSTKKHLIQTVGASLFDAGLSVTQAAELYRAADSIALDFDAVLADNGRNVFDPSTQEIGFNGSPQEYRNQLVNQLLEDQGER